VKSPRQEGLRTNLWPARRGSLERVSGRLVTSFSRHTSGRLAGLVNWPGSKLASRTGLRPSDWLIRRTGSHRILGASYSTGWLP